MRRQALDVFVNRIASHSELQQSEDLRTFLQADEEVMLLGFVALNDSVHFFCARSNYNHQSKNCCVKGIFYSYNTKCLDPLINYTF